MLIPVVYPSHVPAPPPPPLGPPTPPGGGPPPEPPPPQESSAPPSPDPARGDVPRSLYLLRLLWLCVFPLGIVLAGVLVLLTVPQAAETLLALDHNRHQSAALVLAFALWLFLAWFTARLLLDRRFKADTLGECSHPGFALGLRTWVPRALIPAGGLPISGYFLIQPGEWPIGLGLSGVTAALAVLAWKRRRWMAGLRADSHMGRWLGLEQRAEAIATMAREDSLSGLSRLLLGLLLLLQWALLAALLAWPEGTARLLGAPALVLFAFGSWIAFGGIVLTYLPKSLFGVHLTALPLLLFLLAAPFNDNHQVAHPERSARTPNAQRLPADAHLQTWLRTVGADGKRPLVLVAVAGGASRAAYWGSAALARLQDLGELEGINFADSIFTISGTSGGALGAASFVAALDARRQASDAAACTPWALVRDFTGQDHLATPVGFLLYPDLLQRLLPITLPKADRSLSLEGVWTRDWPRSLQAHCPQRTTTRPNPWSEPFTGLHQRATEAEWLPLLALNTAALGRGQRVYQADYLIPSGDGLDLLDPSLGLEVERLSLAQAVHNSARFPYISPADTVKFVQAHKDAENDDVGPVWDRLGDGGYVDASATLTLSDLLRDWEASGKLRSCTAEENCAAQGVLDRARLRLVLLINAPAKVEDWLCRDAPRAADAVPIDGRRYQPRSMGLAELVAPPAGVLASNSARGQDSTVELIKRVGGCSRVAELRLPRRKIGRDPSMNWMLNQASRDEIDLILQEKLKTEDLWAQPAQAQLSAQLRQARGWMLQMK